MKTAEYKLPMGVHPSLEPVETGRTPDAVGKNGEKIPGKPIYSYTTIQTREAETLAEFGAEIVEQDKPEEHVLSLAQAQRDIIVQRKIREAASSQEVSDMFDGKTPDTKDLDDDERKQYVVGYLQQVESDYRYGSRGPATGGAGVAAKQALKREQAIAAAAAANPEVAAKLAALQEQLAALGISA